jgi:hypothetical protein
MFGVCVLWGPHQCSLSSCRMHSESIHRYCRPNPLVTPTASRNVFGRVLSLIPSKLVASFSFVVHAHGGGLLSGGPQQCDKAQYRALSPAVSTNRMESSGIWPTSRIHSAGIGTKVSSMMVLDMLQRQRSCAFSSGPYSRPPRVHLSSHRLIIAIVPGPSSGSAHTSVDISRSVLARLPAFGQLRTRRVCYSKHRHIPSSAQIYTL